MSSGGIDGVAERRRGKVARVALVNVVLFGAGTVLFVAHDAVARPINLMMHPSSGFRLTVVTPNEDFLVEAMAVHPEDLRDTSTPGESATRSWELDYGVFPGQGISCEWRPREARTLESSQLAQLKGQVQNWMQRRQSDGDGVRS